MLALPVLLTKGCFVINIQNFTTSASGRIPMLNHVDQIVTVVNPLHEPQASTATTFGFNNLALRFEVDGMKYLLCVPLLSISSVSNDAEATTCSNQLHERTHSSPTHNTNT
jgi:hypothetical protein